MKVYPAYYNLLWDERKPAETMILNIEEVDPNVELKLEPVFAIKTFEKTLQTVPCDFGAITITKGEDTKYSISIRHDKIKDALTSCVTFDDKQEQILPAIRIIVESNEKSQTQSNISQEVLVPLVITNKILLDEVKTEVINNISATPLVLKNLNCDSSLLFIKKDIFCSVEVVNESKIPFQYDLVLNGIATFPWRSELDSKLISSGANIFPKEQKRISFTVPSAFFQSGPNIIGVKLAYSNQYLEVPLIDAQGYHLFYISAIVLIIGILLGVYYVLTVGRKLVKSFKNNLAARQDGRKTKGSITKDVSKRKRV